jgi:Fe2+ transport system protein FeoA
MTRNHADLPCHCLQGKGNGRNGKNCRHREPQCPADARPLSESCGCGRVKVCKISGDRRECARMAHLGVLPGSEMELICPGRGRQCMIRVNGGTLSLDDLTASNIFVRPV